MTLDVAYDKLADAGFDDEDAVKVEGGGTFGVVIESNWTVCEQSPAAGESLTDTPILRVDRSCGDDSSSDGDAQAEDSSGASHSPEQPKVITVKNNADFAALLKLGDNCSNKVKQFAKEYSGRKVRFDGAIVAMQPHGDTNTRFDMLVSAGDFNPDSARGPSFQFRDTNAFDLNITGKHIPDYVKAGQNYTFTADLDEYDPSTCLYQLWPEKSVTR